jgi:hypothetical protein
MLFREIVAVYYENHTEHTNTLCVGGGGKAKNVSFLNQTVEKVTTEM